MEKNKYYTPDIKEFRVGFEYEYYYHPIWYKIRDEKFETWEKRIYTGKDFAGVRNYRGSNEDYDGLLFLREGNSLLTIKDFIRVKLLDKEDIESFGFEFQEEILNVKYFYFYSNNAVYQLTHSKDYTKIIIKGINSEKNLCIFRGKIKNKSELEIVLKQIGVI